MLARVSVAAAATLLLSSCAMAAVPSERISPAPEAARASLIQDVHQVSLARSAATGSAVDASNPTKWVTQISVIDPLSSAGTARPGWKVRRSIETGTIDCSLDTGSVSALDGDTHACGSTADAANTCWASPHYGASVLCVVSAWSTTLTRRRATHLPGSTKALKAPQPLAVELSDGSQWDIRIGGALGGRADGLVAAYTCRAGSTCTPKKTGKFLAILTSNGTDTFDKSKPAWTARVGELGDPSTPFPKPRRLTVRRVWFVVNSVRPAPKAQLS